MKRSLGVWVVFAAALLTSCGGNGATTGPGNDGGARLTAAVASALSKQLHEKVVDTGVSGASAAVMFPDGREWTGVAGEAVLKPKQAMTPRTSLPFDSVTKVVVAAEVLKLAEQHRLSLDDPIVRWYPAWRGDGSATVRDLLGHTSGAADPAQPFWNGVLRHPGREVSARDFLAASPKPGPRTAGAEYANTNFVIAGLVVEHAAGAPVAGVVRRGVLNAPGGGGLALQPVERPHPPLAHSYWYPRGLGHPVDVNDGGSLLPSRTWASMASTAGGLAGDVPSLARWAQALLGGRLLKPASLTAMTRFHAFPDLDGYGLGLMRDSFEGRTMWGHIGDGLGSHTELWYLPRQRVTVAVSWNDDLIGREGQILPALLRAVLDAR